MVFLDSSPVIYFVERTPRWGAKVAARIAALRGAGAQLVVSDLVRMETAIGPLKANDPTRLADFATFFAAPHVTVLPITATVCDRAARIRAQYGFKIEEVS
jgi:predicted nucleic acid-binding protein